MSNNDGYVQAIEQENEKLRRRLDAAEKVVDYYNDPMNKFSKSVELMIDSCIEHQSNPRLKQSSHPNYIEEMCTIAIKPSRQIGLSTAVIKYAVEKFNRVDVLTNMVSNYHSAFGSVIGKKKVFMHSRGYREDKMQGVKTPCFIVDPFSYMFSDKSEWSGIKFSLHRSLDTTSPCLIILAG